MFINTLSKSYIQIFPKIGKTKIFSKYLKDPENLFVISSDFCHWGKRFRYTYYDKSKGSIHESIEDLDKQVFFYTEQKI